MKNSSYGYYGSTAAASSFDDVVLDRYGGSHRGTAMMSRGMQLEAAVEKLPGWYFGVDDDKDDNNIDGDKDDDGESERWHARSSTTASSSSSSARVSSGGGGGSSGRARRSQLYYLDDDLLGSVAELALSTDDDDCDAENNPPSNSSRNSNVAALPAPARSQSIRSRYLLDSPLAMTTPTISSSSSSNTAKRADAAPMSNSTASSTLDTAAANTHRKPSDATSSSASSNNTHNNSNSQKSHDASPPRGGRQHRLSSRRSTLSSSCACTDLVVTRYTMGGRDKKVMYHIDVVNHESQLQTYTIRRSYTDFKALHSELNAVLDARKEYYTSRAQLRQTVLDTTGGTGGAAGTGGKERRSLTASNGVTSAGYSSGSSFLRSQYSSPEDAVEAAVMAFSLPTLPHAGLMSFWRRHDHSHLKHRCEVFQSLLRAILKMPFLRESFAMQKFLSTAPCAIRERGSSYVSLCEYSVPHIDLDEEHRERRRRAQEHRRNSSVTSASMGMYEY